MNQPQSLRKNVIAALCCTAFGTAVMPAVAAEAELMRRIDALQQELQALKAQVNAQPAPAGGGGGVSAPAGFELSVYGVGHLSADRIDTGADSSSYLHSNSSRLGFKGSQVLGGGMSAIFQYESGVDLTGNGTGDGNGGANSGGQIFTRARDSFVGLKGNFGTVVIGRLAGFNQWVYDYNLFGDQVGDLGNIWGQNQPGRLDSAAQYRTPDFSGFSAALTYDPSGNQGAKKMSSTIVKADYGNAGLKLGGAYATYDQGAALNKQKTSAITGSYDFGAFNVGGGWQRETDIFGVSGQRVTYWTLGAGAKVGGSGMVKVQYARAGDNSGTAVADSSKQWALGYDHAWDKNTTLYVAYAKTNNDLGIAYQSYDWGHGNQGVPGVVAGNDPKALSFGIVYKFDMGLLGKR